MTRETLLRHLHPSLARNYAHVGDLRVASASSRFLEMRNPMPVLESGREVH